MSAPSCPPPTDPDPPPTLNPDVVADDETLGEAVDAFIGADPEARARRAEIVVHQEALRSAVDGDVWGLVLHLDELTNARWADLAVVIARWAFEVGRRLPLSVEEATS